MFFPGQLLTATKSQPEQKLKHIQWRENETGPKKDFNSSSSTTWEPEGVSPAVKFPLGEAAGCSQELQLLQEEIHRLGQGRAGRAGPALPLSLARPDWRAHLRTAALLGNEVCQVPDRKASPPGRLSALSHLEEGWGGGPAGYP